MASDLLPFALVIVAITADGLLAFNNDPFLSVGEFVFQLLLLCGN